MATAASDSDGVDVLIINALQSEYESTLKVAAFNPRTLAGVESWEKHDQGTSTPYVLGRFQTGRKSALLVAVARPTRMGSNSTVPITSALIERVSPRCLAMCGVCAGNPAYAALGDVVVAEMVYAYDEGKRTEHGFEGDFRQQPFDDIWLRAAQELIPTGLPSFGEPLNADIEAWFLERIYFDGSDPRHHPGRSGYLAGNIEDLLRRLETGGYIYRDGLEAKLTESGRTRVERDLYYGRHVDKRSVAINSH